MAVIKFRGQHNGYELTEASGLLGICKVKGNFQNTVKYGYRKRWSSIYKALKRNA
jgi:hypothetical protein